MQFFLFWLCLVKFQNTNWSCNNDVKSVVSFFDNGTGCGPFALKKQMLTRLPTSLRLRLHSIIYNIKKTTIYLFPSLKNSTERKRRSWGGQGRCCTPPPRCPPTKGRRVEMELLCRSHDIHNFHPVLLLIWARDQKFCAPAQLNLTLGMWQILWASSPWHLLNQTWTSNNSE